MGQLISMFLSLIGQLRLPTPNSDINQSTEEDNKLINKSTEEDNKLINQSTEEDNENIETFTGNIDNLLKTRTNIMSSEIFKRNVNKNILGPKASSI